MAARLKDKDIDFYRAFYQKPEKPKADSGKGLQIFFMVFLILLVGSVFGYFRYRIYKLSFNLAALQTYIEDPGISEKYQQAEDQQSQYAEIKEKEDSLVKIKEALKSYPVMTGSDFQKFLNCCGTTVTIKGITFDSNTATLTFYATAAATSQLPEYIQRLQDTQIFSAVVYTGYKINADGKYDCAVTCTLKTEGQP